MFTPPEELTDADLVAELADGWGVRVASVEYLTVGFGSHHWRADGGGHRWFVTVDDLDAKLHSAEKRRDTAFDRLRAALVTARCLHDCGLSFVVAPVPTRGGEIVRRVADRFALALYPYIRARTHPWGEYESRSDRLAVLELVIAVHGAPPDARMAALSDEFLIPNRHELVRAIEDVGRSWDTGPYAQRTRALLSRHARGVDRLLAYHDRLAAAARAQPERAVLTHGEPHSGNTMLTEKGWMLVDWDTTLLAPPERDLWTLASGERSVIDAYTAATGRAVQPSTLELYRLDLIVVRANGEVLQAVQPSTLELYRLGWDLTEIAIYITLLRRPHKRTADVDSAWSNLNHYLDPERRWPSIT